MLQSRKLPEDEIGGVVPVLKPHQPGIGMVGELSYNGRLVQAVCRWLRCKILISVA
jgi:hypothetical protein